MSLPIEVEDLDMSNHLIIQELAYNKESLYRESQSLLRMLNPDQREAFTTIMDSFTKNLHCFFFIYSSGDTGKTFL